MTDTSISIRPEVGMLNLFPNMKYQPWYALGELVDNAIQSYVANRDALRDVDGADFRLRIEIEVDRVSDTIVVRDNAAGIAGADWQRAFRVADPPADNSGLSQFGVGMKAACCWFARKWSVRSSALGENEGRTVTFDVPMIVETRTRRSMSSSRRSRPPLTSPRCGWNSCTESLRPRPSRRSTPTWAAYIDSSCATGTWRSPSMARQSLTPSPTSSMLRSGLIRKGESHVWRKDIDLRLESGGMSTGFVAVRAKGATASAGLALFYRNKVVTGAGEETYRPREIFGASNDFRSQRVFGELHMDDFAVTYTKDSLVWHDEEDDFLEALRAELELRTVAVAATSQGVPVSQGRTHA
ncbi:ATP-binding protein [Aeromicrobium sp. UC242_57]|uniref:ATP-binding protein n=1 Tax=Aeromicrobium sp. UC242_57 TaxID=3374624 RepID=UPI0037B49E23